MKKTKYPKEKHELIRRLRNIQRGNINSKIDSSNQNKN